MSEAKPFSTTEQEVWEAYKRVNANSQSAISSSTESFCTSSSRRSSVAVKRWHRWFPKSNLLTVGCLLANSALVS
jgi:hypothetical protein